MKASQLKNPAVNALTSRVYAKLQEANADLYGMTDNHVKWIMMYTMVLLKPEAPRDIKVEVGISIEKKQIVVVPSKIHITPDGHNLTDSHYDTKEWKEASVEHDFKSQEKAMTKFLGLPGFKVQLKRQLPKERKSGKRASSTGS